MYWRVNDRGAAMRSCAARAFARESENLLARKIRCRWDARVMQLVPLVNERKRGRSNAASALSAAANVKRYRSRPPLEQRG